MSDKSSITLGLLQELIKEILPSHTPPDKIQNYQNYALRILSSRLVTKSYETEDQVRAFLVRSMQKTGEDRNLTKQTTNHRVLRIQELFTNLTRRKILKNKLAVCYLLGKISENNQFKNINISSMDNLLVSRQSRQINNENINSNRIGNMEIEPSETGVGENSTILRRTEPQENITKLVHKIANKGNSMMDVSENDLLRDVLFAFQRIDGTYVYYSPKDDKYLIKPIIALSEPVKKMVLDLCEMGWLYKNVSTFIEQNNAASKGLVFQALCGAIKDELEEYYRLIATLEGLRDTDDEQSRSSYLVEDKPAEKSLSLRKLYLWSLEPFERLKWMCILCDSCKESMGGVIISNVYSYAKQGSPSIQVLINKILRKILAPFSDFLRNWIYKGELVDQYNEFFIKMDQYVKDEKLWFDKYKLNKDQIPRFLDLQLAERILVTGKSVVFMKRSCGVQDWALDIDLFDLSSEAAVNVNQNLNFARFQDWVLQASDLTNKALLAIMSNKFRLIKHFETIKKFLLFGQGDFIQNLMDSLVNELSKSASTIYKHDLVGVLEGAIRASNAKFVDPELQARIDVKLLDASPGDTGWDVFSLTYSVDPPLTTVLSAKSITGYLRLFNFLWRIKRIEHSLSAIWLQHMKGATMLERMREYSAHVKKCNLLRNEMIHFIGNLLNYLMYEVIQSSWERFTDGLRDAQNLDQVIKLHEEFVNSMLEKALLTTRSDKIYRQVIKLFDFIYRFKSTQEILLSSIQEEQGRAMFEERDKSMLTESAAVSFMGNVSARGAMKLETMQSLQNVAKEYKTAFIDFVERLKTDDLGGKLRFLTFRLDFNEYYASLDPNNAAMRERDIQEFRIPRNPPDNSGPPGGFNSGFGSGFGGVPRGFNSSLGSLGNLGGYGGNMGGNIGSNIGGQGFRAESAWNQERREISPPKFNQEDKMLTEDIGDDLLKSHIEPSDNLSSFRFSPSQQDKSKSTLLKTIDFDTNVIPKTSAAENLSDVKEKFARLTALLDKTKRSLADTKVQEERGSAAMNLEEEPSSQFYLKSVNFGDEPPSAKKE